MALREIQATTEGFGQLVGKTPKKEVVGSGLVKERQGKTSKNGGSERVKAAAGTVKEAGKDETILVSEKELLHSVDADCNTDISFPANSLPPTQEEEMSEMLLSTTPTYEYMKLLAEERRKALAKALEENKKIWAKFDALETENADLRKLAEEGMQYAQILKAALDSEEEEVEAPEETGESKAPEGTEQSEIPEETEDPKAPERTKESEFPEEKEEFEVLEGTGNDE